MRPSGQTLWGVCFFSHDFRFGHRPLTTTNSHQELIMADANHKARPPVTERSVTIQESWRYQKPARLPFHMRKEPATFP